MKPSIPATAILSALAAGSAWADCTTSPLVADASALLTNTLVCGRPGPGYPGAASDRWQEEHIAGGLLYDYKMGVSDPVDPRKQVGLWSGRNSQAQHNYIGGSTFTWQVRQIAGNTYSFCLGASEHVRATVTPAGSFPTSGCGGTFPP